MPASIHLLSRALRPQVRWPLLRALIPVVNNRYFGHLYHFYFMHHILLHIYIQFIPHIHHYPTKSHCDPYYACLNLNTLQILNFAVKAEKSGLAPLTGQSVIDTLTCTDPTR